MLLRLPPLSESANAIVSLRPTHTVPHAGWANALALGFSHRYTRRSPTHAKYCLLSESLPMGSP